MSPAAPQAKNTIASLQVMRALAALAVVAFHIGIIMAEPKYGAQTMFLAPTSLGWMGVNFFFVLSGFIIFFAHAKDIGRPERIGLYLWRRFARVYPTYWVFLTLFIAAALAGFGFVSFTTDWGNLATAYTLVRFVDAPTLPLKVAWTLVFEVFFYGMFALLILNRHLGIAAFAGWLVVIGVCSFVLGSQQVNWTSAWSLNFFFGAFAWWAYARVEARWGSTLLAAGIALLAALLMLNPAYDSIENQQADPLSLAVLGLPFMLILLGGALWEQHRRFVPPRLFLLLGEASYAIYLVHSAVISAICLLSSRLVPGLLPQPALFALIFVAATGAGVIAHRLVERPLLKATRKAAWPAAERPARQPPTLRDVSVGRGAGESAPART